MFRLKQSFRILGALLCLLAAIPAVAQAPMVRSVMVVPFVNQSGAPGLEWIGEAFPEVLSQRMTTPRVSMISREDRTYAFDHTGIPLTVQPSRATIYEVAEQMDADYVVMGTYKFDGVTFSASAQLLDMKKLHLFPPVESSGSLTNLIDLQTSLAWELLQQMGLAAGYCARAIPEVVAADSPGCLRELHPRRGDRDRQQKIHYLRQAVKLNPNYAMACFNWADVLRGREYECAALFAEIPRTSRRRRG